MTSDAQAQIDNYLNRLQRRLSRLSPEESREILQELRTHIVERASESGSLTRVGVDNALATLGDANYLADEYLTDYLLAQAETSRSPFRILDKLFRWASLSVAGFLVLASSVAGYFLGGVLALCAVLKIIHPQTAGLWAFHDSTGNPEISIRLGFGSTPAGGRDVVGWWIVPIGLLVGCGLVLLTTRFALWCARRYRRSLALPLR